MSRVYISNIQKFCVYDGPGIRTVVFFMGCPLQCKWCQNPENLTAMPKLMFNKAECLGCGRCMEKCQKHAISRNDSGKILFNATLCDACGRCTKVCLQQAREICGEAKTVEEVFEEVMKDEVFFKNTGGGITLSGGECTLFPEYTFELLSKVKRHGVHTAIETCGYCELEALERIEKEVDLFLYDFKLVTAALHKKWTGQDNQIIKRNLEHLIMNGRNVVIRIPLIEGVNDKVEFLKILDYLKEFPAVTDIHILPFHQLGAQKYGLSGKEYEMNSWKECSQITVEECRKSAKNAGFKVNVGGWNL